MTMILDLKHQIKRQNHYDEWFKRQNTFYIVFFIQFFNKAFSHNNDVKPMSLTPDGLKYNGKLRMVSITQGV
jgi:hypothetical protein